MYLQKKDRRLLIISDKKIMESEKIIVGQYTNKKSLLVNTLTEFWTPI